MVVDTLFHKFYGRSFARVPYLVLVKDIDVRYVVPGTEVANERYLSLIHISEPTRLLSISYAVFCLK